MLAASSSSLSSPLESHFAYDWGLWYAVNFLLSAIGCLYIGPEFCPPEIVFLSLYAIFSLAFFLFLTLPQALIIAAVALGFAIAAYWSSLKNSKQVIWARLTDLNSHLDVLGAVLLAVLAFAHRWPQGYHIAFFFVLPVLVHFETSLTSRRQKLFLTLGIVAAFESLRVLFSLQDRPDLVFTLVAVPLFFRSHGSFLLRQLMAPVKVGDVVRYALGIGSTVFFFCVDYNFRILLQTYRRGVYADVTWARLQSYVDFTLNMTSFFGEVEKTLPVLAVLYLFARFLRRSHHLSSTAFDLMLAVVVSGMTSAIFKWLLHRDRPFVMVKGTDTYVGGESGPSAHSWRGPSLFSKSDIQFSNQDCSFPSGHAATATAMTVVIVHAVQMYIQRQYESGLIEREEYISRKRNLATGSYLLYAISAGTGFVRVWHNNHWMSDVTFGIFIGLCIGNLVTVTMKSRRPTLPRLSHHLDTPVKSKLYDLSDTEETDSLAVFNSNNDGLSTVSAPLAVPSLLVGTEDTHGPIMNGVRLSPTAASHKGYAHRHVSCNAAEP